MNQESGLEIEEFIFQDMFVLKDDLAGFDHYLKSLFVKIFLDLQH